MKQTKIESLIESSANTALGFVTAFFTWQLVVAPLMGYTVTLHDNLIITSIFTVVSVIRGYLCRRFFNAGLHRAAHSIAKGIFR